VKTDRFDHINFEKIVKIYTIYLLDSVAPLTAPEESLAPSPADEGFGNRSKDLLNTLLEHLDLFVVTGLVGVG
jgi:hypothetical protein